ncbi:FAD:protein FMN transferase [Cellulomonas sp. KRMCY2]|uniref:FAD:protein FMN transferase n=1 Tax=Cellulomonas sp. KRMCY2 TaxID=1304865 RepID=UPI00045E5B45|nr:FAD:protein FMN transferase [Cellulomonas sp. KRMCY2]
MTTGVHEAPAPASASATEPATEPEHRAWVEQIMGMPISVHLRGAGARGSAAEPAVAALFADLRAAEAMFSTYRDDSQISRIQRGELDLADADPAVREVHRLCEVALIRTDGWFDAWNAVPGRPGVFDPTGLVKTWAVGRAARMLDHLPGPSAAIGAGGDVLIRPGALIGPGADAYAWRVGIEDPRDRTRILATVPLSDGGVATSGIAARGAHILDPHTGEAVTEVLSATVIGPSLLWADVWATTAVARGAAAVDWVATLHGTSGMLVLADGTIRRWSNEP